MSQFCPGPPSAASFSEATPPRDQLCEKLFFKFRCLIRMRLSQLSEKFLRIYWLGWENSDGSMCPTGDSSAPLRPLATLYSPARGAQTPEVLQLQAPSRNFISLFHPCQLSQFLNLWCLSILICQIGEPTLSYRWNEFIGMEHFENCLAPVSVSRFCLNLAQWQKAREGLGRAQIGSNTACLAEVFPRGGRRDGWCYYCKRLENSTQEFVLSAGFFGCNFCRLNPKEKLGVSLAPVFHIWPSFSFPPGINKALFYEQIWVFSGR